MFAELFPAEGIVTLGDGRTIDAEALRALLSGAPAQAPVIGSIADPRLQPGWGKADDRLVAELDALPEEVRAATRELYGRTATEERDARAGEGATAQKRGRVTRHLVAEVAAYIADSRAHDASL